MSSESNAKEVAKQDVECIATEAKHLGEGRQVFLR
jgi:hypothetical protein